MSKILAGLKAFELTTGQVNPEFLSTPPIETVLITDVRVARGQVKSPCRNADNSFVAEAGGGNKQAITLLLIQCKNEGVITDEQGLEINELVLGNQETGKIGLLQEMIEVEEFDGQRLRKPLQKYKLPKTTIEAILDFARSTFEDSQSNFQPSEGIQGNGQARDNIDPSVNPEDESVRKRVLKKAKEHNDRMFPR
jgi:hypothetical protein